MADVSTLPSVELGVLGPLQVRQDGATVTIPGTKPRAILTMLGLHNGSVVSADILIALLWGDDPPRTAAKALQTHISSLRRALGDGVVVTEGTGWTLQGPQVDATRYKSAAKMGRDAAAAGDTSHAVARFEQALALWRGIPELPEGRRGTSEKTRWIEGYAALVEDRADALLATGRAAELVGELEGAVADAPLRERRWGQLMLALYRAGRQGEALGAYQRARALLAEELGVDPGPDLRRLEAAIVAQDSALETPAVQHVPAVTRAVTFLLTDIEGSTAAWEANADAMAVALARHDELVEQVVTSRGGRLIKPRGAGEATFSVFERPSAAAAAAIELQEAITGEPWALREPMRIRVALHTGEVEFRDGDYFGRAVNRAARLRSLAAGGQILCSGATAELVIDSLPDDVVLADLGTRELRNLARPERVFELRLESADDLPQPASTDAPLERPILPPVLAGPGPFVGRGHELAQLFSAWQTALAGATNAMLIAGEPGVGKTRLAGEWSRQAYDQGALVIYGRCDEDLGAPYQPFAEALRSLVPCLGASKLRGLRGVEALLTLVPGLADVVPDLPAPTRADPDTERYALFDAVVAVLGLASTSVPVVLILDDLHWAAKPTLLLLRHLLRFGEQDRVQIIGTYRSTDLDRSHPLAAMLADLHRDGTATRIQLSGLDESDVTAYVAEAGYHDEELARALASVTGGNPFFLIEALRHVDESGGQWDPSTLPQGVREAVSRRLSRLPAETNKALAAAAVVGSRFALELVEHVFGDDLVDAFDEACKAGIVIEEPGGRYRFNHALVRQSLLAELPSVRRMRLHQRIAATLESQPGAEDELLAELAHHYFECAWAGNAAKAVEYCRRAADQAMARLAYEGAADLYDRALHALEEIDDELPDRDEQIAVLLVARCEALLAAGDVASAAGAVSQLQDATRGSVRLAAWATCFDGQLSMLIHPERLDNVETALGAAAEQLAGLDDAAGEAKAHTVRAYCLARLGRIGDCEIALDDALTAARRAREHRWVNAVLAGAPLAALWGPNPVPRAGGRCLDVVRLLRITTDSPAVEATSTRCQAVLEAFRGRPAAARRMIDSARRTITELGLRHALLEVEQFAGIVELVVDDPAAAEPHLRQAYNGFRRMGLEADTAETAALLGRACLALDRDAEADELCTESERLAGHALKASIAWRTLRAQLLSRGNAHGEARLVAEAAVSRAERTDALVDHGDACLALATVLDAAGDARGARAAAERAADLYERKGAAALAEKAQRILGEHEIGLAPAPAPPEPQIVELDNACARAIRRVSAAVDRGEWDEFEKLHAPHHVESRRKIVGFTRDDVSVSDVRGMFDNSALRLRHTIIAVRGERLALTRFEIGSDDMSPGAPHDEMLQLIGLDEAGRVALEVFFDIEDIDAATAELDAQHSRFENQQPHARRLENAASQLIERLLACFVIRDWDTFAEVLADDISTEDRRRVVNAGIRQDRDAEIKDFRSAADLGVTNATSDVIATRGERLVLIRSRLSRSDVELESFHVDLLWVVEIDADDRIAAWVTFDPDHFEAAISELDARYLAGEGAANSQTWSAIARGYAALNHGEFPPTTPDFDNIDHRRAVPFAPGELIEYMRAAWDLGVHAKMYIDTIHQLSDFGAVVTHSAHGTSPEGADFEWREVNLLLTDGERFSRCELFDETDLDAALAKFEQLSPPARRLENAATRACERSSACFAAREWDALAEILADDVFTDDRRRLVGEGIRLGRDAVIAEISALADVGVKNSTSEFIATRGSHLVLRRFRTSGRDQRPEQFHVDVLDVIEINADERIAARVVFDPEDIDGAFEELDARYLAGEASAYAHTWSLIVRAFAAINRHELPELTPDWVNIDHRRGAAFATGDMSAYLNDLLDDTPDINVYMEVVHRLSNLGAVITQAAHGTSQQGFQAEWREIGIFAFDGDLLARYELFDDADVDAAIAKFEQLSRPAPQLQNAASQVAERFVSHYAAGDWGALAEMLADNFSSDDRRRVVGAGVRDGRDAQIMDMQAMTDLSITKITSTPVAIRGERLVLIRGHLTDRHQGLEAFLREVLAILEIDADERIVALVSFDLDDFEAAIAELDARYVAGEAAAHARTWSVITGGHAALNRREFPATTTDLVSIDHRRGLAFAPGELIAYFRAGFDLDQDIRTYVEVVHRLSDLGAVCTHAGHGISREGFDAEWRGIDLLAVDGDRVNRCEVFEETDLDAALAKFEQLSRPAPQLQNAASRASDRYLERVVAHDWDALADMLADDYYTDDRRHLVGGGIYGREAEIVSVQAQVNLGVTHATATVIAARGERLALSRVRYSGRDQALEVFVAEILITYEINADDRIAAAVAFDPDDIDAAVEELDARFLRGEGAAHASTWSVIATACAALKRRELPPTTPDWVNLDHRRGVAFSSGDMTAYIRAVWDDQHDVSSYIDAVHQLNDIGAVFTQVLKGTSQDGFDAEWQFAEVMTVEGGLISRADVFDETDLDAALAKFEQLSRPAPQPENAASRVDARSMECFAAQDWDALAEMIADDHYSDDRRRVIGAGIQHGRYAQIHDVRSATAEFGPMDMTSVVIATRGDRLALRRSRYSRRDQQPGSYHIDCLHIIEIGADERIAAVVTFDADDIDAAFQELDARYLAGEAAAYAQTWAVIGRNYAAFNRRELPLQDWVTVDHRRATPFALSDMTKSLRDIWDLTPDLSIHIEAVHRLNNIGAVITHAGQGTSREGFDAEWRAIDVLTVDGGLINRTEVFDETDIDAAIARFDELQPQARRLENAASQVGQRYRAHFAAGNWDAMADIIAEDFVGDDRRRVVGSGVRIGRDAQIADMRAIADLFIANMTWTDIATRGDRLVLFRVGFVDRDQKPDAFHTEVLCVAEIDADERIVASVSFDVDDIDAAFEELDARYIASEAAAHSHTWSVIARAYRAINRHELPPTTPDWVNIDHRRGIAFAPGEATAYLRASQDPQGSTYVETVHRLSNLGAVFTWAGHGTSQEGSDVEFRGINVLTVEGDLINRCEIFDEADLDAALARFDELHPQAPRLENAASRVTQRCRASLAARDWDAMAEILAEGFCSEDRRRVVNSGMRVGRDVGVKDLQAAVDVIGITYLSSVVIATRGERLELISARVGNDEGPEAVQFEVLQVTEIDSDERIAAVVTFDVDDIDAAFEDLDARYLAGEAAAHPHAWSVVSNAYAAMNRHELFETTPDWVNVDHRRPRIIEEGGLNASLRSLWKLIPDVNFRVEAVHRLSDLGAVCTHAAHGVSQDGFDAEWRGIELITVDGQLINRCEIFDEADLDAAIARFEELQPQAPPLENAASQVAERFLAHFAAGGWDAMAGILADDFSNDDRRRVVGAGVRLGRDAQIADMRAVADVWATNVTSTVIATRGGRLALMRLRFSGRDQGPERFVTEPLTLVEINADEQVVDIVSFDLDDTDAAFEELDNRYLAGEGADHAHTWSVIVGTSAAFNRHELTAGDWVIIDHRRLAPIDTSDLPAAIRAIWDLTPDLSTRIEAVHRLSSFGAVVTYTAYGTSTEGFAAEWRVVDLLTVEGDRISRFEFFDEADLGAALARFDELSTRSQPK
jgi:DNA-binding SARP family transcriptional activator